MLLQITKALFSSLLLLILFVTCSTFIYFGNQETPISRVRSEKITRSFHHADVQSQEAPQEDYLPQEVENSDDQKLAQQVKDEFYYMDEYARNTPMEYEKNIDTLVRYLIAQAATEIEKIRVLFSWIATHIKYDADAFNSGNYTDDSAENILFKKKAVCQGYSNLLYAFCKKAGLQAETVPGYSKGYGYKDGKKFHNIDHAWNAIKVNNRWALFDVTWASGFGINKRGKLVSTMAFDPSGLMLIQRNLFLRICQKILNGNLQAISLNLVILKTFQILAIHFLNYALIRTVYMRTQ